jgi:hypothetical protein
MTMTHGSTSYGLKRPRASISTRLEVGPTLCYHRPDCRLSIEEVYQIISHCFICISTLSLTTPLLSFQAMTSCPPLRRCLTSVSLSPALLFAPLRNIRASHCERSSFAGETLLAQIRVSVDILRAVRRDDRTLRSVCCCCELLSCSDNLTISHHTIQSI